MSKITGQIRKDKTPETGDNQDKSPDKRRYGSDMAKDKQDKCQDKVRITANPTVISDGNHHGSCGRPMVPICLHRLDSKRMREEA